MINFENLDKFTFLGVGKYDIPQIEPVKAYHQGEFVPVNYHYTAKDTKSKIVPFLRGRLPIHSILESRPGQIHSETVAVCGGVRAGLFHLHRYADGDADIQSLPQALVGGLLAAPRHDGLSNDLMER